ncbi:MAG TPA: hypothetical protein PKV66_00115 [Candidatus Pelethenecus sp.]|nr:hypothetical protein [Candidatus Pelethenecus sp.]
MKILVTFLVVVVGVVIISALSDFYLTMKYGKGWVSQGVNGTAIKTFIKEEAGCVYFVDVWNTQTKTCGDYELKLY